MKVVKTPEKFLQEALTNNSFTMEDTENALRMSLDHAFDYLYRLQRNMSIYEELFYTTRNNVDDRDYGDYFMDARERICVNFPIRLIPVQFREKFRTSKFYGQKISYRDIVDHPTLFTRLPVLLIDNQVVRDFEVEVFDDYFTTHLGFDRYFLHTRKFDNNRWEYEYVDHHTSLQVINHADFTDLPINRGMLRLNSYSGNGFDRLRLSYLTESGFAKREDDGCYFAVLFFDDEKLGSQLLEVDWDTFGDMAIHYDQETLRRLNGSTGAVTIRFYFYRYLHKYTSYRYTGPQTSKMVRMHWLNRNAVSDAFIIRREPKVNWSYPIPTENLLVFRTSEEYPLDETEDFEPMIHYPNRNVKISYPNLYQVTDNDLSPNQRLQVYYFYIRPYELYYEYQFQFFHNYLEYKWSTYPLEKTINTVLFGKQIEDTGELDLYQLHELTAAYQALQMQKTGLLKENEVGSAYYAMNACLDADLEDLKLSLPKNFEDDPIVGDDYLTIPADVKRFAEVFDFIVNHEITPYRYDEIEFLKEFSEDTHPFEYKVEKLKEFIKDDWRCLKNYVRGQNKVAFKYEFSVKDIDLAARYRTERESGSSFKEPMYAFPMQKAFPDEPLSARVFIDGLLCTTFALETFGFSEILYIPADQINEDSYIEIEVFHWNEIKHVATFTSGKPYVDLEFPTKAFAKPTISDIYFFEGTEDTFKRLDKKIFDIEVENGRYNYYTENGDPIQIYYHKCYHGDLNYGPYYTADGRYFSYEGQPDRSKDISQAEMNALLVSGDLVQELGYETDNLLHVVRMEEVYGYEHILAGCLPHDCCCGDKKELLYSDLTKVRITCTDESLFDKEITIAVSKKPAFKGQKVNRTIYPYYDTPIPNSQDVEEYTRAFKNGRQISKNRYDFTNYFEGLLGIQMLEQVDKGETAAFDITPYRNRLLYYRRHLESEYVDLRGVINKPFDPKFFEVYMNGRRLNKTNIYVLSPWEIKLGGCKSMWNFEIYERDRDWEYYGLDLRSYYLLSDFIREPFMVGDPDIREQLIIDEIGITPPNEDIEDPLPWDRELDLVSVYFAIFYYMHLIPKHFVTPDRNDFHTVEIATKYPIVWEMYHVQNDQQKDVLLLTPDKFYKPKQSEDDPIGGNGHGCPCGCHHGSDLGPDGDESYDGVDRWRVYLLGNTVIEDLDTDEEPDNDYWKGD